MARGHRPFLVESAGAIEERVRLRRQLRACWADARVGRVLARYRLFDLAHGLGIDPGWLRMQLGRPQPFGALNELIAREQNERGIWAARWPSVPIESAIAELRVRLAVLRALPLAERETFQQIEPVAGLAAAD